MINISKLLSIKSLSIKIKLIIIFILIKIIPLLLISYIAYEGVLKLDNYLKQSTSFLFKQSKDIILETANASINDSIRNLDKKSQLSLERLSHEIANNIATFLYQRDEDVLFLSKIDLNQKVIETFYNTKKRDIIIHDDYYYDDKTNKWLTNEVIKKTKRDNTSSSLKDNEKEFNYTDPLILKKTSIPLYKEISFFDLEGSEKYKISQIDKNLLDVSNKNNTYINAETYFNDISKLKKDEIYVSNVIGKTVKTKIIGSFTKEKAKKLNIAFEPQNYAYAGKENPVGEKFDGIIRFITPVFKNNIKVGYISLALDHTHIMQFTDTLNPTSLDTKQNIADASVGNYAFMWDYKARNISHPRDYFIVGYDGDSGNLSKPWLSLDLEEKYVKSQKDINTFLLKYPTFENQSLSKRPNIKQLLEEGNVGLDCRYLNFAPQCKGWMEVTQNGGYGSFLIYWSKVWKLTTAASIPYYTGQYSNTKRGFGFITIGANVDEFHAAANETKNNVNKILDNQTKQMQVIVNNNEFEIIKFIDKLIKELSIVTFIMVVLIIIIALWLSNYLSKKIQNLLIGTKKFSNNELDYRIKITSNDEVGKLEKSFNTMASKIQDLIFKEKQLNETLGLRVASEIKKQREQEQILIQQSKLASMGEMIGHIAHQWRQPLNALSLVIQNIKFSYQMGELNDEYMEKSVAKATLLTSTMSRTIDDFRSFFKPNKIKEKFNLSVSLDNTLQLIEPTFKYHEINLIKGTIHNDIYIDGYKNEFLQAILNILNNAKDALIENNNKNKKIKISTRIEENFILIDIEDNGLGIKNELLEKIYNPYFTTKEEGKGTGIGLYMTKTIIENNMNGRITAYNFENGVCFRIKLPIINK